MRGRKIERKKKQLLSKLKISRISTLSLNIQQKIEQFAWRGSACP
jgi:hypothetical protein